MNDAAIRAFMTASSDRDARLALAEEQLREFGQREWYPTAPTVDALGNAIVFKGWDGFRYTVHYVAPDGSHARREQTDSTISAVARDEAAAIALLQRLAAEHGLRDPRPGTENGYRLKSGLFFLRWNHGRAPLD